MNAVVRPMTFGELGQAVRWADAEGWEPGLTDAEAFWAMDPGGFWAEEADGEMVASLSAVRYPGGPVFMGMYMVQPQLRGEGLGRQLLSTVMGQLDGQTLIGDAVPEQVESYEKIGFKVAWWNCRFVADTPLPATGPDDHETGVPSEEQLDELVAFDGANGLGPRPEFLRHWISGPGRQAVVTTEGDRISGFGASRPSSTGWRIGPLIAEDTGQARSLLLALADGLDGPVAVDAPLPNEAAVELCEGLGMTRSFSTARVVRGETPPIALERVYGIASLELG